MKKLNFLLMIGLMAMMLPLITGCSDKEEPGTPTEYTFALSQDQKMIMVMNASGKSADPANPATLAFTADGDWSVNIENIGYPVEDITWVSASKMSGGKGENLVKISATENMGNLERGAVISLSCGNLTYSFTLIQQCNSAVVNPNSDLIDPSMMITRIVGEDTMDYAEGNNSFYKIDYRFEYNSDGTLRSITYEGHNIDFEFGGNKKLQYNERNWVDVYSDDNLIASYAIMNGRAVSCYDTKNRYVLNYNPNSLITVNARDVENDKFVAYEKIIWSNGNLTGLEGSGAVFHYSDVANRTNLDISSYLGLRFYSSILPAYSVMSTANLLGRRSENFLRGYEITSGAVTDDGEAVPGLTFNGDGMCIRVFFSDEK